MGRVIHFEIHCDDLDRAQRFYTGVFGWRVDSWEGAPIDYRLITTGPEDEPGINGALTKRSAPVEGDGIAGFVNTVQVDDLAETHRRVVAGGGELALEAALVPGVGTVGYFKDTEGNVFGALQPL